MEFHIALTDGAPDPAQVQDAMFDIDPMAVVDLDMSGLVMRISSTTAVADLIEVLRHLGWILAPQQVVQQPTICCGGCSG